MFHLRLINAIGVNVHAFTKVLFITNISCKQPEGYASLVCRVLRDTGSIYILVNMSWLFAFEGKLCARKAERKQTATELLVWR